MFERTEGAVLALNKVTSHDDKIFSFYGRMFFWTQYYVRFDCSYMKRQVNVWFLCGEVRTPRIRLIEFQKVEVL